MQSKNSITSTIMYATTAVAVSAVVATVYLVVSKMKMKKKSRLSDPKNMKKA